MDDEKIKEKPDKTRLDSYLTNLPEFDRSKIDDRKVIGNVLSYDNTENKTSHRYMATVKSLLFYNKRFLAAASIMCIGIGALIVTFMVLTDSQEELIVNKPEGPAVAGNGNNSFLPPANRTSGSQDGGDSQEMIALASIDVSSGFRGETDSAGSKTNWMEVIKQILEENRIAIEKVSEDEVITQWIGADGSDSVEVRFIYSLNRRYSRIDGVLIVRKQGLSGRAMQKYKSVHGRVLTEIRQMNSVL